LKRNLLLIILFLSLGCVINAQWYYRSCGVVDISNTTPDELECLWKKTKRTVIVGVILTGAGIITCAAGFGYYLQPIGSYQGDYDATLSNKMWVIGGVTALVGIPFWITGAIRIAKLRKTSHYDNLNLGSLNLSPALGVNQFNGTNYLGISLSLNL